MLSLDINNPAFVAMATKAFQEAAAAHFASHPQPDPQYTCEEVAELLSVDVSTVYTYLKLPPHHQRYLPVVRCTDSSRGNRIRLSAVQTWQERNSQLKLEQPPQMLVSRPARRRRVA